MAMIVAGQTANFIVSYDSSLNGMGGQPDGPGLAQSILNTCEADLASLSALFGGIMPPPASLPFQINLVPGAGGAGHASCAATAITCFISAGSNVVGLPALVVAEVAEVFMAAQAKGWNCGWSNGEALSRVLAYVVHPNAIDLFSVGGDWLNSANPSRPDWVDNVDQTDQHNVSTGCGTLFLNYLAHQLNFGWPQIIAAAAPNTSTLAETAAVLGLQNAFNSFAALLATYFPTNATANLQNDDPFPLGPLLYLRHNLADDGTSHTGPLASSPDIIVKNNVVANPQATYSTPASINSDTESDANVIAGQANYVYLRVWNHGTDATNVTATAYWSPPATLVTPNLWNLIGSSQFADVPPGRIVEVSDPGITWPSGNIPAPGHYCFVATVGNALAPAPVPNTFNTFNDYVNYIYANNNITWRNFNVVAMGMHKRSPPFGEFLPLRFLVTGAWDEAHTFAFEILAGLPQGSRLALQLPHRLGRTLRPAPTHIEEHQDADSDPDDRRRMRIALAPDGSHHLGQIELHAKTAAPSHMLVHVPAERHTGPCDVAIRQLYEGREVGRITWRLVPGR